MILRKRKCFYFSVWDNFKFFSQYRSLNWNLLNRQNILQFSISFNWVKKTRSEEKNIHFECTLEWQYYSLLVNDSSVLIERLFFGKIRKKFVVMFERNPVLLSWTSDTHLSFFFTQNGDIWYLTISDDRLKSVFFF